MTVELHYQMSFDVSRSFQDLPQYRLSTTSCIFRQLALIWQGTSLTYAINPEKRLLTLQPILILFTP